jgi:hypothetical protein
VALDVIANVPHGENAFRPFDTWNFDILPTLFASIWGYITDALLFHAMMWMVTAGLLTFFTLPRETSEARRLAVLRATVRLGRIQRIPSGKFAENVKSNPTAGALSLTNVTPAQGALPIMAGDETIGAIGISGAPGGDKDEACAKAGLDKVAADLK